MLRTQSCVYRREKCLLAVYVDDMLIMGSEGDVETTEKMLSGLYNIKHLVNTSLHITFSDETMLGFREDSNLDLSFSSQTLVVSLLFH
mmetsp:Transcript_39415/g.156507  ORF Transcript_39415/g.156507 Transcript_39415/m.156507 type:complete len:88 (-) Transcript_39415:7-270(-)